jgi:hypothetical protein
MKKVCLIAVFCVVGAVVSFAEDPVFKLEPIDTEWHRPEGCCVLDVNGDGRLDVASGPYWYECIGSDPKRIDKVPGSGQSQEPLWRRHALRECGRLAPEYHRDFGEFALDVNGDGLDDIVTGGWAEDPLVWYENLGIVGKEWKKHEILAMKGGESFMTADVDRDGDLDIIPSFYSRTPVCWLEKKGSQFIKHVVGTEQDRHGVGFGDVDGDGRGDIVTSHGWYRAPEDPTSGQWEWHPEYDVGGEACIPMIVMDVNGDGRSDIISGAGHHHGLAWFEQKPTASGREWVRHAIDDTASQFHTIAVADVDADGELDIITGKRYRGHNGDDAGAYEPQGVYWFKIDRRTGTFGRHVLAYNAMVGVGMNITVRDIDKDGDLDIVVPGKSGIYLFRNMGHPGAKSK